MWCWRAIPRRHLILEEKLGLHEKLVQSIRSGSSGMALKGEVSPQQNLGCSDFDYLSLQVPQICITFQSSASNFLYLTFAFGSVGKYTTRRPLSPRLRLRCLQSASLSSTKSRETFSTLFSQFKLARRTPSPSTLHPRTVNKETHCIRILSKLEQAYKLPAATSNGSSER